MPVIITALGERDFPENAVLDPNPHLANTIKHVFTLVLGEDFETARGSDVAKLFEGKGWLTSNGQLKSEINKKLGKVYELSKSHPEINQHSEFVRYVEESGNEELKSLKSN